MKNDQLDGGDSNSKGETKRTLKIMIIIITGCLQDTDMQDRERLLLELFKVHNGKVLLHIPSGA